MLKDLHLAGLAGSIYPDKTVSLVDMDGSHMTPWVRVTHMLGDLQPVQSQ